MKGENNTVADALSRYPVCSNTVTVVQSLLAGIWKRIQYAATRDRRYQDLLQQAQNPQNSLHVWKRLVVDADSRIFVPEDNLLRTLLIAENHDPPLSGHFGVHKTKVLVERHWTWDGLARDVRHYVRTCVSCQKNKHNTTKPPGRLYPIVAKEPWEIVTMDFVEVHQNETRQNPAMILVMVDKFSKYTMLELCTKDTSAIQTAEIFVKRVVRDHGIPKVVISDRGPQFVAKVWQHLLKSLHSQAALSTTHHPQTDGQTERAIQTLRRIIRSYVYLMGNDYLKTLPLFQFALNNAPATSTTYSPFQILYGRYPKGPPDTFFSESMHADPVNEEPNDGETPEDNGNPIRGNANPQRHPKTAGQMNKKLHHWVQRWWKARLQLRAFVRAELEEAAHQMKRLYDRHRPHMQLQEGDWVLLSTKAFNPYPGHDKSQPRFSGLYVVIRGIHPNAYEIEGLPTSVPRTQNVRHLRLFLPSPSKFKHRPPQRLARPVVTGQHWEWEVEAIIDHRIYGRGEKYLVKWKGSNEATWLRPRQLRHCRHILREYQHTRNLPLDYWSSSASPEALTSGSNISEPGDSPPPALSP